MVHEDGIIYYLALSRKCLPTSVVRVPMKIPKLHGCHTADAQYKFLPSCPLRKVILVTKGTRKCRLYFMTGLQGTRFFFPPGCEGSSTARKELVSESEDNKNILMILGNPL